MIQVLVSKFNSKADEEILYCNNIAVDESVHFPFTNIIQALKVLYPNSDCITFKIYSMSNLFKSRGCRNNNPFNIVKSRHNWIGKVKGNDSKFETFVHIGYGLRAGIKLLLTYISRGYNTPRKIINRFAPASENATSSYLDFITYNYRGERFIRPDDVIKSLDDFSMLCSRIVKYENGLSYRSLSAISADPDGIKRIIDIYNLISIKIC